MTATGPIQRYLASKDYIDREIVRLTPRRRDPEGKVRTVRAFLKDLGNPQACAPAIQVAGTSGKGSVSFYLASILRRAGLRTGLHVSPYLQVATEKTWVDGRYASADQFADALERIRPVVERYRSMEDLPASVHSMASLGVTLEILREEALDWLVMETGMGGRYDFLQGLSRAMAVITDIGLDHQDALGNTLEEIAWHKAGIMEGAPVAVAVYQPQIWPVLERAAAEFRTTLVPVVPEDIIVECGSSTRFVLEGLGEVVVPGQRRGFEVRNMAIALATADRLHQAGMRLCASSCAEALAQARFPGRLEWMPSPVPVMLDGAHNPQKMQALSNSLPRDTGRPLILLFGVSGLRDAESILGHLSPRPEHIVLWQPRLYGKDTATAEELAVVCRPLGGRVHLATSVPQAMATCLSLAAESGGWVLATGSLYSVGSIRNLWYPWRDVLVSRDSWCARGPQEPHGKRLG